MSAAKKPTMFHTLSVKNVLIDSHIPAQSIFNLLKHGYYNFAETKCKTKQSKI